MTNPDQEASDQAYLNDEIDLKELFTVLWDGKLVVLILTSLAALVSVMVAMSLPNIYTANALLAPADDADSGMGSYLNQYSGIASLAGVSLPGGGESSKAGLAIELMQSRSFIGDFVEKRDLLPELMAVKEWNSISNLLSYDETLYDAQSQTWVREVPPPYKPKPSRLEAYEALSNHLSISQNKETGFVSVSFDHQSPFVAANWVKWLIDDVNETMRAQDIAEATRATSYLREQVEQTSSKDIQALLFELIQRQTETAMLAEVRPEYVFKTIDPAVAPEVKSKPNRALICVLGMLLGGMLGVVIVLIQHYARSESEA